MRSTRVLPLLALLVLPACADNSTDDGQEQSQGVEVSRASMGEAWPLTVESGRVWCENGSHVLFTDGARVFAVNGSATSQRPELPEIDEVWADDPSGIAPKVNIGPLISAGLEQC